MFHFLNAPARHAPPRLSRRELIQSGVARAAGWPALAGLQAAAPADVAPSAAGERQIRFRPAFPRTPASGDPIPFIGMVKKMAG